MRKKSHAFFLGKKSNFRKEILRKPCKDFLLFDIMLKKEGWRICMILKIVTFNAAHGKGDDGKVSVIRQANFLKEYHPDIVFLQEVDMYTRRSDKINQIRLFSEKIGLAYSSMESNIVLEGGYYGDGIISRFPIAFSSNYLMPKTDPEHEQRGILCNKISFGTTKINLFSLHLSTYEDERILAIQKLVELLEKIDPNELVIIGGDFNVGVTRLGKGRYIYEKKEEYEEYRLLKEKLSKVENTEDTWFSELGKGCIDTIFFSNSIKLRKFETIDVKGLSDHSAVYAEFDI